jgi:hypothetical protein
MFIVGSFDLCGITAARIIPSWFCIGVTAARDVLTSE